MAEKRKHPYIWVTWLSKIMAGEQACLWASWFKAHHQNYRKAEGDFDLARWNMEHTRLLVQTRMELARHGATVRVESQNAFQHAHADGVVLAGKPDIVALDDVEATVVDCKTGRPKISDRIQVQIYMYVLPICFPRLALYTMHGRVIYPDHQVEIQPAAADEGFGKHLDYFLDLIASKSAPLQTASVSECRFCDITREDCAERVERAGCVSLTTITE
jgi:hypothetical protein